MFSIFQPQLETLEGRALPSTSPLSLSVSVLDNVVQFAGDHAHAVDVDIMVAKHAAMVEAPVFARAAHAEETMAQATVMAPVGRTLVIDVVFTEIVPARSASGFGGDTSIFSVAVVTGRDVAVATVTARPGNATATIASSALAEVAAPVAPSPTPAALSAATASASAVPLGFGLPPVSAPTFVAASSFLSTNISATQQGSPLTPAGQNAVNLSTGFTHIAGADDADEDADQDISGAPAPNTAPAQGPARVREAGFSTGDGSNAGVDAPSLIDDAVQTDVTVSVPAAPSAAQHAETPARLPAWAAAGIAFTASAAMLQLQSAPNMTRRRQKRQTASV